MKSIPITCSHGSLNEISHIEMGQSPPSTSYNELGEGLPFFQGKAEFGRLYPSIRKWTTDPKKIAEKNDILISVRAPVGPTNLAPIECCIGRGLAAIRAYPPFFQKYLLYYLRNKESWLLQQGTGSTFNAINKKFLQNLAIPVAPGKEQIRIVHKLDTLLERVQACQDHLDRLPLILEHFRQSVLTEAMSGRMTEDWREENKPQSAELTLLEISEKQKSANIKVRGGKVEPSLEDLPNPVPLPEGWAVSGFDGLAAAKPYALKAGPFGSSLKKSMYSKEGYKIYGQEQVISGNEDIGDYYIDENKYQELISCAVNPGDILISLVGTIGKILVLSQEVKPGIINPRLVKMSLDHTVNRDFISLYLSSPLAQNFFKANSHGGTMDILNLGILRKLPLLVPSNEEQQQIVCRVRALFSLVDEIEKRYSVANSIVEKITPSLLEKAFRGELGPQDPNDEPASVLLERIKTEREAQKAATKKTRKKSSKKVVKMTKETVSEIINQMSSDKFSFDELQEIVTGDYETLKEILFELLGEKPTIIQQVFDASSERIVFVRRER